MTRTIRPQDLIDSTVMDPEGSKIGKVGTVYLSDETQRPEWVTVKTGLFGHKESFVPLSGANVDDDGLHVQVVKNKVSDAPRIDAEEHLSQQESMELYEYYGMPQPRSGKQEDAAYSGRNRPQPGMRTDRDPNAAQHAQSGPQAGAQSGNRQGNNSQNEAMIRSEERLRVGKEQVETGHVRLRKYVVTEEQQVTVPVSHEEVRLEREPITNANRNDKAKIGEEEQDIVLHAEKPVVSKETVAVEKVRMGTQNVTEEQTVTGKIRKEQIDFDNGKKDK